MKTKSNVPSKVMKELRKLVAVMKEVENKQLKSKIKIENESSR